MITRDELIEAMAREIDPAAWSMEGDADARKRSLWEATAALRAIESAGLAIVPTSITPEMREAVRANGGDQFVAYANAGWPDLVECGRVK